MAAYPVASRVLARGWWSTGSVAANVRHELKAESDNIGSFGGRTRGVRYKLWQGWRIARAGQRV